MGIFSVQQYWFNVKTCLRTCIHCIWWKFRRVNFALMLFHSPLSLHILLDITSKANMEQPWGWGRSILQRLNFSVKHDAYTYTINFTLQILTQNNHCTQTTNKKHNQSGIKMNIIPTCLKPFYIYSKANPYSVANVIVKTVSWQFKHFCSLRFHHNIEGTTTW